MNKIIVEKRDMKTEGLDVSELEFTIYRINNDVNGNPRYLIHFLDLGLKDYDSISHLTGFKKYKGKKFGGGYVFQSYNVTSDLAFAIRQLRKEGLTSL